MSRPETAPPIQTTILPDNNSITSSPNFYDSTLIQPLKSEGYGLRQSHLSDEKEQHLKRIRMDSNPWRMTTDPKTGQIWIGNNGQDLWEQVYCKTQSKLGLECL